MELIISHMREKYIQKASNESTLNEDKLLNDIILDLDSLFQE